MRCMRKARVIRFSRMRERHPLDRWTVTHAALGTAYGVLGLTAVQALALSVAFEVAESRFVAESPGNVTVDVLANMVGWYAGRALRV